MRALVQRLGPHVADIEPIVVGVGDQVDPTELVERLVRDGYRREYQVEHRGEVAVRGSIVDVFPSTADAPIRIDLWGDEVDRLGEFSVADQRTTIDRSEVEIFPCRELLPTDEVRERAAALIASQPWGREQWERLAEGQTFDGMESWLPWLVDDEGEGANQQVLFDMLDADAQVLLFEPRRMRDRAADILAEEDDLARTLSKTWGVDDTESLPQLHLPFDRLLVHTDAPAWSVTVAPEGPDVATVPAAGWDPVVGEGSTLVAQLERLLVDGYRVVVAADGTGSADRLVSLLGDQGVHLALDERGLADLSVPGGHVVVMPLERGFLLPSVKLAVLAESDVTGRRRAHRRAKPRKAAAQGFFDDLKAGDHVVHHQHGVARYGGMVKRTIGGVERDYLLLEYRGDDKLYVPSDQIDTVRHYTGGDNPSLSRLGGGEWQKSKAKVRAAVTEIAQELVVLYQKRVHTPGHAFAQDTPWQRELEESFPYEPTPDQSKAIIEVKGDMEGESPMDRLVCGDVGFGKTEVAIRAVFKAVQDGKQAAVLVPTTLLAQQHFTTFTERFAGYPVRVEVLSRFLTNAQAKKVIEGLRVGRGRRGHRHPPAARPRAAVQGPRPAGGRRGAALRGQPQGGHQGAQGRRRRAHAVGHADPPHAGDEPHRHPRPHPAQHAARRAPADPHLRRRVRRPRRRRGHPPRAAARGPGLLRAQPGEGHRPHGRAPPRARARGPDRGRPRPDGRGHPREGRARLLGGPVRRPRVHHDHRVRHRHADGEHPRRRPRRPARPGPAPPAAGPRRPLRAAGPTPTCSSRPTAPSPRRPTSGSRPSARPPSSAPASRSPCATSRSAAPATCSAPARAATSPRSATTSTARWSPRRWPS